MKLKDASVKIVTISSGIRNRTPTASRHFPTPAHRITGRVLIRQTLRYTVDLDIPQQDQEVHGGYVNGQGGSGDEMGGSEYLAGHGVSEREGPLCFPAQTEYP